MALFEPPPVIPGFDKLVLKVLAVVAIILITGIVVTITSIVGIVRAVRRRRRGAHSKAAAVLAAIATAIAAAWLLYWVGDDLHNKTNPISGLLAINSGFCILPLSWLIAAMRANRHTVQ